MPPMPRRPASRHLLRLVGRRLPRTRGTVRVDGLDEPLTIARDRWGIPHVDAASERDAWLGLGFCHGQDRAWQLELLVRAGRGRLAELLGAPALPVDRLSRRMGFRRIAERQVDLLDADVLSVLESYVAGINAALGNGPRPHELVLLRARSTPWKPLDVLAFLGLQSFALAGNWDVELARLRILVEDGPQALASVDPTYVPWLPVASPVGAAAGEPLDRLADDLALVRDLVAAGGGSNSWALAGTRTASGATLLANDPHLAPTIPAPWYLAHLTAPGFAVAGASFVGGPAFPTGTNGHAAWGITAGLTDSCDLFVEELGVDGRSVRDADGWVACEVVREEIGVRGARPHVEDVLVTPRGSIISPLLDGVGHVLSMRATWLEARPVRGLLDAPRATSFETFRRPFAAWAGPSLNLTYADRDGHVAWQLVGTLPRRRRGSGTIPLPGWDPANGWDGDVPFDDMPYELDPPTGFVVSANNAPRRDDPAQPFLGVDWIDGYRAARIVEELARGDRWDVPSSQALQTDVASLPWRELRDEVLALRGGGPVARGVSLLRDWDGRVTADSPAASVFELFLSLMACETAARSAPRAWRWSLGAGFGPILRRTLLVARSVGTIARLMRAQPVRDEAASVLGSVVERLEREHGTDQAGWAWGRLRPLMLRHALGVRAPLEPLLNVGPVPVGGDMNTVAQAGVSPLDPLANPGAIANHRAVIDLDDPERSRFVLAGGQSGNPLSPHYADLFDLWLRGEGVPIAWSSAAVDAATTTTLVLQPVDAS